MRVRIVGRETRIHISYFANIQIRWVRALVPSSSPFLPNANLFIHPDAPLANNSARAHGKYSDLVLNFREFLCGPCPSFSRALSHALLREEHGKEKYVQRRRVRRIAGEWRVQRWKGERSANIARVSWIHISLFPLFISLLFSTPPTFTSPHRTHHFLPNYISSALTSIYSPLDLLIVLICSDGSGMIKLIKYLSGTIEL